MTLKANTDTYIYTTSCGHVDIVGGCVGRPEAVGGKVVVGQVLGSILQNLFFFVIDAAAK